MNPVTGLALGRIAVGVVALARPELLDVRKVGPESQALITQAFGSREIALGALTLVATGGARRNAVLAGVAVDAADAATAYLGIQRGELAKPLGLGLTAVAAGAVVTGLLGLRQK